MKRVGLLILISLIVTGIAHSSEPFNITPVSELMYSGLYDGIRVVDDLAYCANGYGLVIIDVSDPDNPVEAAHIPTPGFTHGVFVQDDICYLTDSEAGLMIFDVDDPESPQLIGVCDDPPSALKVWVDGDYAYVTNYRNSENNIISVEDLTNPHEVAVINDAVYCTDVVVDGRYAYFSSQLHNRVMAVYIRDPENPRVVDNIILQGVHPGVIKVYNERLFVSGWDFKILSIREPRNLRVIGEHEQGSASVSVNGNYAFLCGGCLIVYDISDLGDIRRVTGHYHPFPPGVYPENDDIVGGSVFSGGYVYNCLGYAGVCIFDVRDPEHPRDVGLFQNPTYAKDIELGDEYAYVCGKFGRFLVFSMEDPSNPELFSEVELDSEWVGDGKFQFTEIKRAGDLLIAATDHCYLHFFSLEEAGEPELINSYRSIHRCYNFDIADNYLYFVWQRLEITVMDISDPTDLQITDVQDEYFQNWAAVVSGNHLITTHGYEGIAVWDRQQNGHLSKIGELVLRNDVFASNIAVRGDYAYVQIRSPSSAIAIISLANPEHPQEIALLEITESQWYSEVSVVDSFLFVADMEYGVKVFSLEDPERPVLTGNYDTPGWAHHVKVSDGLAYVADVNNVAVYDVSRAMGACYIEPPEESNNFGDIGIDSVAVWEYTVSNVDNLPSEITDITIDNEVFTCSFDTTFSIPANSDTTLLVFFTPQDDTTYNGTLILNSLGHEFETSLSGRGIVLDVEDIPSVVYVFGLQGASPNPFNSTTIISYSLDVDADVTLSLFDLSGREVARLVNNPMTSGKHSISWDASDLPSGIYMCRLSAGSKVKTTKLALVK
ncbi:MAG: T9SS type A sorting domain-containing protein [Candidatus Hatepunaea meridiana]|nr:T9SS type A sorting domain-containing protein [Candidatus Hatepunaea meridiana]